MVSPLEGPRPTVGMYLARAAKSRALAQDAVTDNLRDFHRRMETSWMNLAASTASAERADLFLHTVASRAPPCDTCPKCCRLMRVSTIEADPAEDVYTFACTSCGVTQERKLRS